MALGTTNISTTLVANTIGVGSNDVGTLCTSTKINKWSKYKPISAPFVVSDSNWFPQGTLDKLAQKIKYGLKYSTINADWNDIHQINWNYDKPFGGTNSPYRLGDFRKYKHDAIAVASMNIPDKLYTDVYSTIQLPSFLISVDDILTIKDFLESLSDSYLDYYFGIAVNEYAATFGKVSELNYSFNIDLSMLGILDETVSKVTFFILKNAITGEEDIAPFQRYMNHTHSYMPITIPSSVGLDYTLMSIHFTSDVYFTLSNRTIHSLTEIIDDETEYTAACSITTPPSWCSRGVTLLAVCNSNFCNIPIESSTTLSVWSGSGNYNFSVNIGMLFSGVSANPAVKKTITIDLYEVRTVDNRTGITSKNKVSTINVTYN